MQGEEEKGGIDSGDRDLLQKMMWRRRMMRMRRKRRRKRRRKKGHICAEGS